MKKYDVVVVGAGPAGCAFLNDLDDGFDCLLLDKNELPHYKVCGGLLTTESRKFIRKSGLNPPSWVYSHPQKIKKVYTDLDNGEVFVDGEVENIDRTSLNKYLLGLLEGDVEIKERHKLESFNYNGENIELRVFDSKKREYKKIECDYLVGADGVYSNIRRGLNYKQTTKYIAIQDIVTLEKPIDDFFLIFSNDITDYYSWIVPKGDHALIGSANSPKVGNKNDILMDKVKRELGINFNFERREGFSITRPKSEKEVFLGNGNVMLIGEAAGWISPSSGDGISYALRSAHNCAEAFNQTDDVITQYNKNSRGLMKDFRAKLEKAMVISSPEKRKKLFEKRTGFEKIPSIIH